MGARILILRIPDWTALERAAAAFERERSVDKERALAAALQAFGERAERVGLYAARVGGRPLLN
jgi:hypothetical protein